MKIYILTSAANEMAGFECDASAFTSLEKAHKAMEEYYNEVVEMVAETEETTVEELEDEFDVDMYCDTWCAKFDGYGIDYRWNIHSEDLEVTI